MTSVDAMGMSCNLFSASGQCSLGVWVLCILASAVGGLDGMGMGYDDMMKML